VGHFPRCGYNDAFQDEFGQQVRDLKAQLVARPFNLRIEMLQFQFERIRCEEQLCMINSNEMPLCSIEVTFPIHFANRDNSRLVYGEESESCMCFMHGTMYPMQCQCNHEEQEYDDENDDRTDAIAASKSDDEKDEVEGEQAGRR